MRFVFAIISFIVAALLIATGFAQRTIFLTPDRLEASVSTDSTAPVTIIDGATLNALPRSQTISIDGSDTVFAAYGRTSDVLAWVGQASYNTIGYDPETQELTSSLVEGTETEVPDPAGSDLWLADYSDDLSLRFTVNVPEDISVLVVSDGVAPAPANVSLTWPLDNSTPWSGPLLVGGGIMLLIGLAMLVWAITHLRRARGPRRKQPKMPKMPKLPKQPRYKPAKQKALPAANSRGRRSIRTGMIAVPMVLVGALTLGACSTLDAVPTAATADLGAAAAAATTTSTTEPTDPTNEATPTPSDDPTEPVDSATPTPAVTVLQATRIIARIADVVAQADEDKDAKLLKTRLAGPALELRLANYKISKKIKKASDSLQAFPSGPVQLTLPQDTDSWPRTVFAVIQNEEDTTVPSVAYVLIQDDPRSLYKVHYAVTLEPGTVIPKVASPLVGAARLLDDVKLLTVEPSRVAARYGNILMKDKKSDYFDLFEAEGDSLREDVGVAAKKVLQKKLPSTAKLTFDNEEGEGQIVTLSTTDSGAIVAVQLNENQTVKPVEEGAAVNAPEQIEVLSGKSVTTKGLKATYSDQLLFYVPSAVAGGKITLLGYSTGLVSASELKK